MAKAKSLYISYDGMTDPLGQSQVLPYLKGISESGYEVHLISFEKPELYAKGKDYIEKLIQETDIKWIPLSYTKSPPLLSTLWDIFKLRRLVKQLHLKNQFKIVHCRSYISALIGLWLKRKHRVKFIFDMRGFWADERVDGGLWNLKNPIFRAVFSYFKKMEKVFLFESDRIISLTNAAKNIIGTDMLVTTPVSVIPCCVDLRLFNNETFNHSKNEKFTMGYLGGIGTWYMLPEMLDFFKILLQKYSSATFHIVTKEDPKSILQLAETKGIPIPQIKIESAERIEIPNLISSWSFSIFFIKPVFSKKASSPTKQGEIMAMGIPIVCNSNVGDTDHVIEAYNAGWLVNEFSNEEYESVVMKLTDSLSRMDNLGIRKGAEEFYSLEKGIRSYLSAYKELV